MAGIADSETTSSLPLDSSTVGISDSQSTNVFSNGTTDESLTSEHTDVHIFTENDSNAIKTFAVLDSRVTSESMIEGSTSPHTEVSTHFTTAKSNLSDEISTLPTLDPFTTTEEIEDDDDYGTYEEYYDTPTNISGKPKTKKRRPLIKPPVEDNEDIEDTEDIDTHPIFVHDEIHEKVETHGVFTQEPEVVNQTTINSYTKDLAHSPESTLSEESITAVPITSGQKSTKIDSTVDPTSSSESQDSEIFARRKEFANDTTVGVEKLPSTTDIDRTSTKLFATFSTESESKFTNSTDLPEIRTTVAESEVSTSSALDITDTSTNASHSTITPEADTTSSATEQTDSSTMDNENKEEISTIFSDTNDTESESTIAVTTRALEVSNDSVTTDRATSKPSNLIASLSSESSFEDTREETTILNAQTTPFEKITTPKTTTGVSETSTNSASISIQTAPKNASISSETTQILKISTLQTGDSETPDRITSIFRTTTKKSEASAETTTPSGTVITEDIQADTSTTAQSTVVTTSLRNFSETFTTEMGDAEGTTPFVIKSQRAETVAETVDVGSSTTITTGLPATLSSTISSFFTTASSTDIIMTTLSSGKITATTTNANGSEVPTEVELADSPRVRHTTTQSNADILSSTTVPVTSTEHPTTLSELEEYDFYLDQGACIFDGRIYQSAEQIPRTDACEFCFCFRGDIICLQQTCPPPLVGCHQTEVPGYCCPRYECPILVTSRNLTKAARRAHNKAPVFIQRKVVKRDIPKELEEVTVTGCEVNGTFYEIGQPVKTSNGPCLYCHCDYDSMLRCDPKKCKPEPPLVVKLSKNSAKKR